MLTILLIGSGGFAGAVLRYLISGWVQDISGSGTFPYGTLAVNIAGCFLIGILGGWADNSEIFTSQVRMLIFVGLLGGFTTYSTFGYETISLLRDREILFAFMNVFLHLTTGLGSVWLGYVISTLRG